MTRPDTLHERIAAELARRTAVANAATPGPWTVRPYVYGPPEEGWGPPSNFEIEAPTGNVVDHYPHEGGGIYHEPDAAHIALHDPADALRRYAGELEVLERHAAEFFEDSALTEALDLDPDEPWCRTCRGGDWPCADLKSLASRLGVSVDG
jgi:hypothetical protein